MKTYKKVGLFRPGCRLEGGGPRSHISSWAVPDSGDLNQSFRLAFVTWCTGTLPCGSLLTA
jgi:hypothetical protein